MEQFNITVLRYENHVVFDNSALILYDIEQHLKKWESGQM